jgi:hypothetical protein
VLLRLQYLARHELLTRSGKGALVEAGNCLYAVILRNDCDGICMPLQTGLGVPTEMGLSVWGL